MCLLTVQRGLNWFGGLSPVGAGTVEGGSWGSEATAMEEDLWAALSLSALSTQCRVKP